MCPGFSVEPAQFLEQSAAIHRADLVQNDQPLFASESARDARRIRFPLGRHRGDNDRLNMTVDFVGRNDKAGTRLPDFAADCGIKLYQIDIKAT